MYVHEHHVGQDRPDLAESRTEMAEFALQDAVANWALFLIMLDAQHRRKEKRDVLKSLLDEYQRLAYPSRNKNILDVVADFEMQMSKNPNFTLDRATRVVSC